MADKDKRLKKLEKRTKKLETKLENLEKSLKKRKKRCQKKGKGASAGSDYREASKSAAHAKCDHDGHGDKTAEGVRGTHRKPAGNASRRSTRSTGSTRKPAAEGD